MSGRGADLDALKAALDEARAGLAAEDPGRATDAFRRALAIDPEDRAGAALWLALLEADAPPARAPEAYVAALFDQQAAGFDALMIERLGYVGPLLLRDLLTADLGAEARFARALDLGCGAGLGAEALSDRLDWVAGVDLSEGMLAEADEKELYDALFLGEAVGFLESDAAAETGPYDLILAADLLPYLGETAPLFAGLARALGPGGRAAFSAEALAAPNADGWALTPRRRYAHDAEALRRGLAEAGLTLRALETAVARYDAGAPVLCHLVLAAKDGAAPGSVSHP